MRSLRPSAICAGILSVMGHPAAAQPQPVALASLSLVTEPSGLVDAPVLIAGHAANLRVDTGSNTSIMTESGATNLGLSRSHVPYHEFILVAGARVTQYAIADSLRFDRFEAPGMKFLVVPDGGLPIGIVGQLGANFLRNYDVEFDFRKAKLNIYAPGHCAGVWMDGAVAQLPMTVTGMGLISVDVQLDGKPATASLNTGTTLSVLSLSAGQDMFGFTGKTAGLKPLAEHNGLAYLLSYPFGTLAFQQMSVANPDIDIQTSLRQRADLILGTSVLRQLHFCIGYGAQKFYLMSADPH